MSARVRVCARVRAGVSALPEPDSVVQQVKREDVVEEWLDLAVVPRRAKHLPREGCAVPSVPNSTERAQSGAL